jgi:DNA-binding NtrC family response regulator
MGLGLPTLARLQKDLIRVLGPRKASIVFTRFGYEWGLSQANGLGELYRFDSALEWFKTSGTVLKLAGMADQQLTGLDVDAADGTVHFSGFWRDSFEALLTLAETGLWPDRRCRILAGILSGYASVVFGAEILVRETSCQAAGEPVCRFEGRPVEQWGTDLPEVKEYFAVTFLEEEWSQTREQIERAQREITAQYQDLQDEANPLDRLDETGVIHRSESMARTLLLADKVAPTGSTVLILGESGTGKEVMARFLHRRSGREAEPFLAINCAALPENLLESELFGHKKGAFTGADADKKGLFVEAGRGTLFLDEVGELPLTLQAKLLRALQEKEVRPVGGVRDLPVHARIVAATNQDLRDMAVMGRFREDLYYRLAVFPLTMTPLRERREDILPLARHFLGRFRPGHPGFSPAAVRKLEAYSWPGNVRELENWIEYAVVLAPDVRIEPDHLPLARMRGAKDLLADLAADLPSHDELSSRYIQRVLEFTGGRKKEAAAILGIGVTTLWRKLKDGPATPRD